MPARQQVCFIVYTNGCNKCSKTHSADKNARFRNLGYVISHTLISYINFGWINAVVNQGIIVLLLVTNWKISRGQLDNCNTITQVKWGMLMSIP